MDASGTSNSSVMNADGGSSNAGDEDSCSMRAGDAFAFDFGILRVGSGRKERENREEFKAEVNKVFRYELDDEKWNPNYMLPEHVEDLKTIREFRNVFDAEVQKLEAYGFQLGTEIATTDLLMEIVEAVDKLQERLKVVTGDDAMSMEAQKNDTLFFSILLRSTFASKRVLNEYMLTREPFDWVIVR
ncbi:hypothetical protein RJ639_001034 [Escallonia herrerae]|uniref:RNA polymerase Rpb1 domain-containing protein n=1 Tax=Escallonia herrerae TaxID=1293975 RepID=A0AA89BJ18_9ASTE|nr:hypothetical protein RJ639_001034 [Escallonia herrerae]